MGNNWIVRKREPEPNPSLAAALAELTRLASTHPDLRSPALTLSRVLSAAFAHSPELASAYDPHQIGEDRLRDALSRGEPIFQVFPPDLRVVDLQRRSQAILAAIAPENPHASSMSRAKIDWRNWCLLTLKFEEDALHAEITNGGWHAPLATSVLRLTLLPVLSACSEALLPYHLESFSPSGSCPHCGRAATLAESRGLEGKHHLRCGLCAAEWPSPRLGCVACGEATPSRLTTLFFEGQGSRSRLVRCDSCGFDLKVLSTLSRLTPPSLLVAELSTVHLDFV